MNCGISMASVITETEQKMEVMRHVALLTSLLIPVSVTRLESEPWNVAFDSLSAPSSELSRHWQWPGSGFCPLSLPWGLAVTVTGLGTAAKALQCAET